MPSAEKLPSFLVIGAMKCATTTLYEDLCLNSHVYLPAKELNVLVDDEVLTESGLRNYKKLFQSAKPDQICGDISTEYSMIPDISGVPERALKILGSDLKIVYLVRNPVERCLSHQLHTFNSHGADVMGPDINIEAQRQPSLLNYSRYAMQIKPWLKTFGQSNIKIIQFEDYVGNRESTLADLLEFLEIPKQEKALNESGANRGHSRPVAKGIWTAILMSGLYRKGLRQLVPGFIRDGIRDRVLSKPELRQTPPSSDTIQFLIQSLQSDSQELATLLNRTSPIWDFDATLKKYKTESQPST